MTGAMDPVGADVSEESLIEAHERAKSAVARDAATSRMLQDILIPQGRYAEAEMWVRSIVASTERKRQRARLVELRNTVDIKRISFNRRSTSTDSADSSERQSVQQTFYNLLISSLFTDGLDPDTRKTLSTWPGPGMTGFVTGIWSNLQSVKDAGCERETLAMAVFDRLHFDMEDPLGSEEWATDNLEAPYRDCSDEYLQELAAKGDDWALKEIGLRLDREGKHDEAARVWGEAAALGNHAAMRNIGVFWLKQNDYTNAELWFNRALEAGNKTVFHAFADLYQRTSADISERWLQRGVDAKDVTAMNNFAFAMQSRQEYREAAEMYRRAAEFGDGIAATNLANLLFHFGELEECEIWLERAADLAEPETLSLIETLQDNLRSGAPSLLMPSAEESTNPGTRPRSSRSDTTSATAWSSLGRTKTMNCTKCGTAFVDSANFCTQCGSPKPVIDRSGNDFESKCEILGELWFSYRDDEEFQDFIEYNDVGLPLAYLKSVSLITLAKEGEQYVNETWDLFIEQIGANPEETYEDLDDLLDSSGTYEADEG